MELLIVRHAQPERVSVSAGSADPDLTPLGLRQAAALAEWVARDRRRLPVRVVSSTMCRARQTAEVVAERCGLGIETDARLAEFDLGSSEYVPLELAGEKLLQRAGAALTTGVWGNHTFDPEDFRRRVRTGFDEIVREPGPGRVVVVCHGGVLNSFLGDVIGRPPGVFFMPRYTSVSRVFVDAAGERQLGSLNELPHASGASDLTF